MSERAVPYITRVLRAKEDHVLEFRRRLALIHDAERVAARAMRHAFPLGTQVRYRYGEGWRHGTAVMYGDRQLSVRLETPAGKHVWISASRLELEP
jgi:hypothetical protein